jgi:hypothetical protein
LPAPPRFAANLAYSLGARANSALPAFAPPMLVISTIAQSVFRSIQMWARFIPFEPP